MGAGQKLHDFTKLVASNFSTRYIGLETKFQTLHCAPPGDQFLHYSKLFFLLLEPLKDEENYDIQDLKSDDDTDDEEDPRKVIPKWAQGMIL